MSKQCPYQSGVMCADDLECICENNPIIERLEILSNNYTYVKLINGVNYYVIEKQDLDALIQQSKTK